MQFICLHIYSINFLFPTSHIPLSAFIVNQYVFIISIYNACDHGFTHLMIHHLELSRVVFTYFATMCGLITTIMASVVSGASERM